LFLILVWGWIKQFLAKVGEWLDELIVNECVAMVELELTKEKMYLR
jgi:hypothetical protein